MRMYHVLSLKWSEGKDLLVWWGPNNSGYTNDLTQAGVYTEDEILSQYSYYNNENTKAVPTDLVQKVPHRLVIANELSHKEAMEVHHESN
ncbi:hypothetical protein ACTFSJ_27605 [Bacillus cereus group sp. MYBK12-2]|uniref:hypothetical protein n=1 Tax=Bacillus cereus group sp. MYBK12-2 TaxID=3450689 RepID=UPI0032FC0B0B|nr:hypothetical protein [Bacillus pacificus]HDR7653557.1 hypothetical protein [Bacillus pacificus]